MNKFIENYNHKFGVGMTATIYTDLEDSSLIVKKFSNVNFAEYDNLNYRGYQPLCLNEIKVAKLLSDLCNAPDYFILPLGYSIDRANGTVNLVMKKAGDTLTKSLGEFRVNYGRHILHLLQGHKILIESRILNADYGISNIIYDPEDQNFKFIDFAQVEFVEDSRKNINYSSLLGEAHTSLLRMIVRCFPDYLLSYGMKNQSPQERLIKCLRDEINKINRVQETYSDTQSAVIESTERLQQYVLNLQT